MQPRSLPCGSQTLFDRIVSLPDGYSHPLTVGGRVLDTIRRPVWSRGNCVEEAEGWGEPEVPLVVDPFGWGDLPRLSGANDVAVVGVFRRPTSGLRMDLMVMDLKGRPVEA